MNISVVIPNYNGRDLLLQNIPLVVESLLSYHKGEKELIVVDDGSKDESLIYLKDTTSKKTDHIDIDLVINDKNMG